MLALRASEKVLCKYLEDEAAYWVHVDLFTRFFVEREEEIRFDGLAMSQKVGGFVQVIVTIKGKLWQGRFVLCGADVLIKTSTDKASASYLFTYAGVKQVADFDVNHLEYPNGSLPGFFTPLPGDLSL
jgi:hypothetical protein